MYIKYIFSALFIILLSINYGSGKKKNKIVSDVSNSIQIDTLPYSNRDFAFFGTSMFEDSLYCIYRKKGVDTLSIVSLWEGKFGNIKGFKLKDTSMFSLQKDTLGDYLFLKKSEIINKDTILFYNKGKYSNLASHYLWYYIISKDESIVVEHFISPDISKIDDTTKYMHYYSELYWISKKQCFLTYFSNFMLDTNYTLPPFLIEIYPFDNCKKTVLPYYYPPCFEESQECAYPYSSYIYPIIAKDKYAVTFAITPQIYEIVNDELKIHELKHPNFSEPKKYCISDHDIGLIGDDFINVGKISFAYLNFLYDKYNDLYYRFYEMEMPDRNEDGMKNIYPDDKKYGFNIISSDFKAVKESVIEGADGRNYLNNFTSKYVLPYGVVDVYFDRKTHKLVHKILKINLKENEN